MEEQPPNHRKVPDHLTCKDCIYFLCDIFTCDKYKVSTTAMSICDDIELIL